MQFPNCRQQNGKSEADGVFNSVDEFFSDFTKFYVISLKQIIHKD